MSGTNGAAMRCAGLVALGLQAGLALADAPDAIDCKLTLGHYRSNDGNPANDVNLRAALGPHTVWVGVYQDRAGLRQWRTGYERRDDFGPLRSVLSLQNASGGAWVGSASAEVGGASYAIVGWGRTNLHNYVNLNYDPNDAITLGVGTRAIDDTELSLFQVRDDRLSTGQRVTHAVLRRRFEGEQRVTVDVFAKRGLAADGRFVHDRSLTLGYDRGPWFARLSHDPHAGFAAATQTRVSAGLRF